MYEKVLVIGKNGQIGQSLKKIADDYPDVEFFFVGRDEIDLSESASIQDYFQDKAYSAIINCAAYTKVDKAEAEQHLADKINHLSVRQLAEIAKQKDAFFIHISTDYVFDGTNHKPYKETDETNPINIYGLTKLKGEHAMQEVYPNGAIIRTSWVFSEFGNNFLKTMIGLAKENKSINVISDQIGTPTYATDLAKVIMTVLLNHDASEPSLETYHYSNDGISSWYDFAKAIFEFYNLDCEVNPIQSKDYPTPAKRPFFSVLNKSKINHRFYIKPIYWKDSVHKCIELMRF